MKRLLNKKGQTLIEIAIGMTILSAVLLSATSVAVSATKNGTSSYLQLLGAEFAQKGIEEFKLYHDAKCHGPCAAEMTAWSMDAAGTNHVCPSDFSSGASGYEDYNLNVRRQAVDGFEEDPGKWQLVHRLSIVPVVRWFNIPDDPTGKFEWIFRICDPRSANAVPGVVQRVVRVEVYWGDEAGHLQSAVATSEFTDWKE